MLFNPSEGVYGRRHDCDPDIERPSDFEDANALAVELPDRWQAGILIEPRTA
jgi:hypothetical protein